MAFRDKMSARNLSLLLAAKDQILAAPYAFQMPALAQPEPTCGTALCVLGHMAVLDKPELLRIKDINLLARKIVVWGIRNKEIGSLHGPFQKLFIEDFWPPQFDHKSAESAAERIDYFLEHGE